MVAAQLTGFLSLCSSQEGAHVEGLEFTAST